MSKALGVAMLLVSPLILALGISFVNPYWWHRFTGHGVPRWAAVPALAISAVGFALLAAALVWTDVRLR